MDRRWFLLSAGAIGMGAAIVGREPKSAASSGLSEAATSDATNGDEVICLPDVSGMMKGVPPPEGKQVTCGNREESQAKMRWAMRHWRELYPTQRVARSHNPLILPRAHRGAH